MAKLTLVTSEHALELLNIDATDESIVSLLSFSVTTEMEKYCHRVLINRPITEYQDGHTNRDLDLKEYPVTEMGTLEIKSSRIYSIISPELYDISPEPGTHEKSTVLELIDGYRFPRGKNNIRLNYTAGYTPENVPEDLKMAFCEILDWMLKRLKARQIGVHVLARSKNHTGPLLYDPNLPEHAKQILETYRRKRY